MPYDPKYKVGQGFDLRNVMQKSSPFAETLLYSTEASSIEG